MGRKELGEGGGQGQCEGRIVHFKLLAFGRFHVVILQMTTLHRVQSNYLSQRHLIKTKIERDPLMQAIVNRYVRTM